jgi:hypothetical protein
MEKEQSDEGKYCSVFYMCFGTLQHKYNCAKNMVYNEEVRTCVRKGSEQDQHTTKVKIDKLFMLYDGYCTDNSHKLKRLDMISNIKMLKIRLP